MVAERTLTAAIVERWLAAHDAAWRSADAAAIADLFSEDAVYHTGPWDEPWRGKPGPFRGRDAIARGWLAGGIDGERFEAETELLAIQGARAVVRRRITYFEADGSIESRWDNCWLLDFDADGRCAEYQEWYVAAADGSGDGSPTPALRVGAILAPMDETGISLQERYAPLGVCFGCGPANPDGLHIRSFPSADDPSTIVAEWLPETQFEAFEGILNGGIVGALLDCHSNWTAAYHLMKKRGAERPSTCVTLEYAVRLHRPTPSDRPVRLTAHVVESGEDRAIVEASLESGGQTTATLRGTFVAVKPDHPAYDRW